MAGLSQDYQRIEVESAPNTKAYCWTVGNEQNPPLLLMPGFTGTHVDLMKLAGLLTSRYFVIVPDMPGWGESPKFNKELTIENYTLYIKSLLEQLKISKITYVGHCMGATLGIELGIKIPEKLEQIFLISTPNLGNTLYHKLLLFAADTAVKFPKSVRPLFYLWRNRFSAALVNIFVIRIRGKMHKLKLIWHYVVVQGEPDENSIEEAWRDMIHFDYAKIKNVKIPVHLVHGNEDLLIPRSRVREVLEFQPKATIDYVKDCGHMPPVENPEGVAEAILRY